MGAQDSTLPVRSPYTGELVGEAPVSDAVAVRAALARAAGYADEFTRHERSEILFGVAQALANNRGQLASLITSESGLCLKDTLHEVGRSVDVFRFAAIEALRDDGESFAGDISHQGSRRRAHTLRVPVGIVAAVTPFNHPLNQVAHKLAPAIAIGSPIVLKPSEKTPLSALALLELIRKAGLPEEAAQVICGPPADVVDEFLAHPAVEVLSFTGSVTVGKRIASRLGYRRAVLELGGNDPLLVLEDADLDEAAMLAARGAFQNSGQRCTAVKRIIAVEQIADELADRLRLNAERLSFGDPTDERTEVGTVIDERAAITIETRVQEALVDGATLLQGGARDGALLAPTVVDHVRPEMSLVAHETFGPIAPVIRVEDLNAAIAVANSTSYALSSGVCTHDWRAISRCIRELRAGTVNIREVPGWRTELAPFGGTADSGLGVKEGVREAMRQMSFTKLYTLPWT
jgi:aldehyde dehydrogenase (NAD+)